MGHFCTNPFYGDCHIDVYWIGAYEIADRGYSKRSFVYAGDAITIANVGLRLEKYHRDHKNKIK